jgi:hypothetical protein
MGRGKEWSQDELEYLQDKWGTVSVNQISRSLKRTVSAVENKVTRLGLGSFLENGDYISWNQLQHHLKNTGGAGYKMESWVKNRNFPLKYKTRLKIKIKVVYIDDFWKWAERNKSFLDFTKMEENIFGKEPNWVKEQRRIDTENNKQFKNAPWAAAEDAKLRRYVELQKYGYTEIAKMLRRTENAVMRRLIDLNIKDRPVKASNHTPWTENETIQLKQMILDGYDYSIMSERLQGVTSRGSKAIRGYIGRIYKTEVLDTVREKIKQENGKLKKGRSE